MLNTLKIVVTDPDPDYLGVRIFASNGRFSGATYIYAGLDELGQFARSIDSFPKNPQDERIYVFGTKDKGVAGGFCALRFYCRDEAGHAAIEVEIEDDAPLHSEALAKFALFPIVGANIDRFVADLRAVEKSRSGEATLENRE